MSKSVSNIELAGYTKLLKRMSTDSRLIATHVSPFPVTRRTLMAFSKIASIATYHKCIRELDAFGYIRYEPSFDPKRGSQVYWPVNWELSS
jgi:hypothetical protein